MENIQIHRDLNLGDSIPRGLNFQEHYLCNISFCREVGNYALDNSVKENVINFVHRWSEYKRRKVKQPGFNILEHYAEVANKRYLQLSFVKSL